MGEKTRYVFSDVETRLHLENKRPESTIMGAADVFHEGSPGGGRPLIGVYSSDTRLHAEDHLVIQLQGRYGREFSNIAEGSKVVMAMTWSPCKACVDGALTALCNHLKARRAFFKLKFLYWSTKAQRTQFRLSSSDNFFDTQAEARAKYREFMDRYPHTSHEVMDDDSRGMFLLTPRFQISPISEKPRTIGFKPFSEVEMASCMND